MDNAIINIDGLLYVKVVDPDRASYGVEHPIFAIIQIAQTTMRGELGKMTLDRTFAERDALNEKIVLAIKQSARSWGLNLRHEIRDIGEKQSNINIAEGRKNAVILASEAARMDQINRGHG